jgi:glycosyltransferase involved in cell wall biosynthesis
MKILFQSKTNLFKNPGGDTVQMIKTKEFLERIGVHVDISLQYEPDLSTYDIVHLFNLMDPQDLIRQMKNAKKQKKPIVLSTIYGLYTDYERNARGGLFQKLANLINPYQIEYIKTLVKCVSQRKFHSGIFYLFFNGYYKTVKKIVDNTTLFLPNSTSEMHRVALEYKLKDYSYFSIPNAIDQSVFNNAEKPKKFLEYQDCILCAGRIEGRKSTLNLVKAVKGTKYKLVLVGNSSSNQKKYVAEVHEAAGDNVFFLGSIPHDDLKDLYQVAKVHVLASWMETPGLSSLEAAVMGCNIVATKKGDTYDYFEDYAFYCEPDNVESIKTAIDKAYHAPFNPQLKNKILSSYTWEKTAEETLKAYEKVLTMA